MDNEFYADKHVRSEIKNVTIIKVQGYAETHGELVAALKKELLDNGVGLFEDISVVVPSARKRIWGRVRFTSFTEAYGNTREEAMEEMASNILKNFLPAYETDNHAANISMIGFVKGDERILSREEREAKDL